MTDTALIAAIKAWHAIAAHAGSHPGERIVAWKRVEREIAAAYAVNVGELRSMVGQALEAMAQDVENLQHVQMWSENEDDHPVGVNLTSVENIHEMHIRAALRARLMYGNPDHWSPNHKVLHLENFYCEWREPRCWALAEEPKI